tara:strand:+ start:933 stop:1199 length:267 start_codon:yes stop_codon:yes gene_type:complete
MRITESKLRRTIRKVIVESTEDYIDPDQQMYNNLYDNLDGWARTNMSEEDLIYKLRSQARRRLGLQGAEPAMIEEVVADWIMSNGGEL